MMMDSNDERDEMEDEEFDDDDSLDNAAFESELEADLIEDWCPVCKDIKPHAISGDKLVCAACNHEHRRDTETSSQAPVIQHVLSSEDRATPELLHEAWQRLTSEEEAPIEAYSIRLKLSEGQVIQHSKFGVGIVTEMSDSSKAEILFSDGLRRLVCGK